MKFNNLKKYLHGEGWKTSPHWCRGGDCQILSEIFVHEHHQTHIGRIMIPTRRRGVT